MPKSISWRLSRVYENYEDCIKFISKNKINNTQIVCSFNVLNTLNSILDQCNIRIGSHGYKTGMNLGIQSDIKVPPPCNINDILTIVNGNEIINFF